jgi:putative flippase GtrA
MRQLGSFVAIGAVGFCVDGGVLTLLATQGGMNVYSARLVSFPLACLATWGLNRRWTFSAPRSLALRAEYARYLAVQILGALANLAGFALLVALYPVWRTIPVIPLALGAIAGLAVNFLGARTWVFR